MSQSGATDSYDEKGKFTVVKSPKKGNTPLHRWEKRGRRNNNN